MRTLVDIPDNQIAALAEISRQSGASRAALVREAIAAFLKTRRTSTEGSADPLKASFGLLKGRVEDGLVFQQRMRDEW